MRSTNTLLVAVVGLLAGACRKETPAAVCAQVATAPAAFLQHWYFPVGSYWVYHRLGSQPLQVDTLTVVSAEQRVFQPGASTYGAPTCTNLYELVMWHSNRQVFRGYSSLDDFRGQERLYSQEENGHWFVSQVSESNLSPLGFLWSYPQRPVGAAIANGGPILLDTLPVHVPAGAFPRSAHLRIAYFRDSSRVDYLYDYHLTQGIGYTRLRYANLGTWQLASFHIAP
jgi:hypothetical protein